MDYMPGPRTSGVEGYKGASACVDGTTVGLGLTGLIVRLDMDRVVKVARTFTIESLTGHDIEYVDYINSINRETVKRERQI